MLVRNILSTGENDFQACTAWLKNWFSEDPIFFLRGGTPL